MTQNHNDKTRSRRPVLQKILGLSVVGGVSAVFPSKWIKPVVDSVVLPAHEQTSDTGERPED